MLFAVNVSVILTLPVISINGVLACICITLYPPILLNSQKSGGLPLVKLGPNCQ